MVKHIDETHTKKKKSNWTLCKSVHHPNWHKKVKQSSSSFKKTGLKGEPQWGDKDKPCACLPRYLSWEIPWVFWITPLKELHHMCQDFLQFFSWLQGTEIDSCQFLHSHLRFSLHFHTKEQICRPQNLESESVRVVKLPPPPRSIRRHSFKDDCLKKHAA